MIVAHENTSAAEKVLIGKFFALPNGNYYPFGKESRGSETANTPKEKFTGKERDAESGLDYFGARYYNPDIVRWTSVDPLWEKHPDWTPYNYVLGNPLLLVDPDGRQVTAWALSKVNQMQASSSVGRFFQGVAQGALSAGSDNISMFMETGRSMINQGEKLLQGDIKGAMQESPIAKTVEGVKQLGSAVANGDANAIGQVVGMGSVALAVGKLATGTRGVTNPIPDELARVIPGDLGKVETLGASGAADVFVTASSDIQGMNASQMSTRLTIPSANSYTVIEFPTSSVKGGIASPINRSDPGFVGKGRTAGGAREFVIENQKVPVDAKTRIVE
jgi:RHS repeat-associated protein